MAEDLHLEALEANQRRIDDRISTLQSSLETVAEQMATFAANMNRRFEALHSLLGRREVGTVKVFEEMPVSLPTTVRDERVKFPLEDAIEKEFLEAASSRTAIVEATTKDDVAEIMSKLKSAIEEDRYHDASSLGIVDFEPVAAAEKKMLSAFNVFEEMPTPLETTTRDEGNNVDRFFFDLISIMTRSSILGDAIHVYGKPIESETWTFGTTLSNDQISLVEWSSNDRVRHGVKDIASPWDPGGLYQVDHLPHWGIWSKRNGQYIWSTINSNGTLSISSEGENDYMYNALWRVCAGTLVTIPRIGEKVFYFIQGHMEQTDAYAERDTDEVFAQLTLLPQLEAGCESNREENTSENEIEQAMAPTQRVVPFCKILTISDTSTHGGCSVLKRHADECLPPLDMSQNSPAQELVAKDLHGVEWSFHHIYRGQPKRHLLTTGWSTFVNSKKLVAGDTFIFLSGENGELRVGVRHAMKQHNVVSASIISAQSMHIGLLASAYHAVTTGTMFSVYYRPRTPPSKFIVPYNQYMEASANKYSIGMRFRMRFEGDNGQEDRCTGTLTGIGDSEPATWHDSKWKCFKVKWDEDSAIVRPERVSPWEVIPFADSADHSSVLSRSKRQRPDHISSPTELDVPQKDGSLPLCNVATQWNEVLPGQEKLERSSTSFPIDSNGQENAHKLSSQRTNTSFTDLEGGNDFANQRQNGFDNWSSHSSEDSWQQVGIMMVTSFNCAYVLSFSNLMLVPLGWTFGITCLLLMAAFAFYANWLLAEFHVINGHRFIRYRDMMGFVSGRKMFYITWILQFLTIFLGHMGFILLGGRALKEINLEFSNFPMRLQVCILITGVIYFLFSNLVPTMSAMRNWLATSAILTVTYDIVLVTILVKDGKGNKRKDYHLNGSEISKVFNAFSAIAAILVCNTSGLLPEIQSPLSKPAVTNMKKALLLQFTVGLTLYYGISIVGYWAYGSSVSDYLPKELSGPKWAKVLINSAAQQHLALPPSTDQDKPVLQPLSVLQKRQIIVKGKLIDQLLIQWHGLPVEDSSWEAVEDIKQLFPEFDLEDKVNLYGGSNDTLRELSGQAKDSSTVPRAQPMQSRQRQAPKWLKDFV